jgi:metallo-beta-lactamase class B
VYYVGLETVCVYLVGTSQGLVLIDSAYDDTPDAVLNNVRTLGFNPADIKYVLVTHSHNDHLGGAAKIKQATRAQVGMSAEDWTAAEGQQGGAGLARDLVLGDGQSLALGDTTFKFYVTPGHTPGSTSIEFQARDGARSYRLLVPGGLGMQFGPAVTPVFLKSMERTKQLGPWDAMLGNHPWLMPVYLGDVQKALATRGQGVHPAALGAAKNNEWLDSVIKVTKEKLALGE